MPFSESSDKTPPKSPKKREKKEEFFHKLNKKGGGRDIFPNSDWPYWEEGRTFISPRSK